MQARTCDHENCQQLFLPTREWQRFCSQSCKNKQHSLEDRRLLRNLKHGTHGIPRQGQKLEPPAPQHIAKPLTPEMIEAQEAYERAQRKQQDDKLMSIFDNTK